jgi:hypothetical protein
MLRQVYGSYLWTISVVHDWLKYETSWPFSSLFFDAVKHQHPSLSGLCTIFWSNPEMMLRIRIRGFAETKNKFKAF